MATATARMEALTRGLPTKSAKIRKLAEAGVARAEIAKYLGIRYQHVRNVLVHEEALRRSEAAPSMRLTEAGQATTKIRVGPAGQLSLPPSLRAALQINEGDVLVATVDEGELRLLTLPAAIRRAQALVRKYVPEDVSLVGELLEDRRREVARERADG